MSIGHLRDLHTEQLVRDLIWDRESVSLADNEFGALDVRVAVLEVLQGHTKPL